MENKLFSSKTFFISLLLLSGFSFFPLITKAATLQDLFDGKAQFSEDTATGGIGSHFGMLGMHFISTLWNNNELWAYYINNYTINNSLKFAIGLAVSSDGVNFTDNGIVLDVGNVNSQPWIFETVQLYHQIGRVDNDGWSANTAEDSQAYLAYGPYTTDIPPGQNVATFKMMIDNNSADNLPVVNLDVFDYDSRQILASRTIKRQEFKTTYNYENFDLNFSAISGHRLEFRTFWYRTAYIRENKIIVTPVATSAWDDSTASFPGIWKDGSTYYLVYEGAGSYSSGDIGLATSQDGVHFTKYANNPILRHGGGWESSNIGTPSLYKVGATWYLFYHGFDGSRVQVGVATGNDLTSLTKYSGNPIITNGPSGLWDEGTIGKRSIIKQGDYYYMIFEGSTRMPYYLARWSSGVARSTDLLNWSKYSGNPVIFQTQGGFGYDGPEFVVINNEIWAYYRVNTDVTRRAVLNYKTLGYFDVIDSSGLAQGWALDPDASSTSIQVHFYMDGPAGQGTWAGAITANIPRSDVNQVTGYPGNHGFNFTIPSQYRDGKTHSLYAYGIDTTQQNNPLLIGSPKNFNLTVPTVLIDIISPAVSISSPASNTTYITAQTVSITASASDNIGVTKVEFYDNNILKGTGTASPYSYPWTFSAADNGAHNWTAKAYDAAGNSAVSDARTLTVNISTSSCTQPPECAAPPPRCGYANGSSCSCGTLSCVSSTSATNNGGVSDSSNSTSSINIVNDIGGEGGLANNLGAPTGGGSATIQSTIQPFQTRVLSITKDISDVKALSQTEPNSPSIQTKINDIKTAIAALLADVQRLQNQQSTLQPPTQQPQSATSFHFTKNLPIGSRGNDVTELQKLLNKDLNLNPPLPLTGYFGPLTQRAVEQFQEKYNIAKKGDTGYGFVGPKTRVKLNNLLRV